MIGTRFTKLIIINSSNKRTKSRSKIWECLCDCGKIKYVSTTDLKRKTNNTRSCGCLRLERIKEKGAWNKLGIRTANINALYHNYKKRAKTSGIEFNITKDYFSELILKNCSYCNLEPKQCINMRGTYGALYYNGIDRINSEYGYVEGNCTPCCKACNYAKRQMSEKEFALWIEKVYSIFSSKGVYANHIYSTL